MPVKFLKAHSIYKAGDIVAFNEEAAMRLVAMGVAEFINPPITERKPLHKMVKK